MILIKAGEQGCRVCYWVRRNVVQGMTGQVLQPTVPHTRTDLRLLTSEISDQWEELQPECLPVNDRWGCRQDSVINYRAGQVVSHPPSVRFYMQTNQVTISKPKSPVLYDSKSSCRDYLVRFEMVSSLNKWVEATRALELATSLRGQAQGVLSDLELL